MRVIVSVKSDLPRNYDDVDICEIEDIGDQKISLFM